MDNLAGRVALDDLARGAAALDEAAPERLVLDDAVSDADDAACVHAAVVGGPDRDVVAVSHGPTLFAAWSAR